MRNLKTTKTVICLSIFLLAAACGTIEKTAPEPAGNTGPATNPVTPRPSPTVPDTLEGRLQARYGKTFKGIRELNLPVWEMLFPSSQLILVEIVQLGNPEDGPYTRIQKNFVLAEKDGIEYRLGKFNALLEVYNLQINEENITWVTEAYMLMTLGNVLDYPIYFSEIEQGDFGYDHWNYSQSAFIDVNGSEVEVLYFFKITEAFFERVSWNTVNGDDLPHIEMDLLVYPPFGDQEY